MIRINSKKRMNQKNVGIAKEDGKYKNNFFKKK